MTRLSPLTKMVATIGPACETESILEAMILAGMNVARFNTKHSDPAWHNERIQRVKKVAADHKQPQAVLLDLQGPEIRINIPNSQEFPLKTGETMTVSAEAKAVSSQTIIVPPEVIHGLHVNDSFLLEDGACEFTVTEKSETTLTATAIHDCIVKNRKTMNTPGVVLDMPSLTERDHQFLNEVDLSNVDYVGLSFVRNRVDLEILRGILQQHQSPAQIVSKIENQAALDNLVEIVEASDAVMVARGDLAAEVPFEELIVWQKRIIELCRRTSKPVITATEMLKSMITNQRPTRAEISDVAHSVFDGTDAVMLSDETTIGKAPVNVLNTQAKILSFTEKNFDDRQAPNTLKSDELAQRILTAIKGHSQVEAIISSGLPMKTLHVLAACHLHQPHYFADTAGSRPVTSLLYGTFPLLVTNNEDGTSNAELLQLIRAQNMFENGKRVLIVTNTSSQLYIESGII